ncbi:50S ribosomal protein L22 [Pontibacter ruber]|uniref:Large ribosomal subunit protein uL22 n=1 Tax=Pontibacter ruber TaxID=1343895 RepID=A0ABW5CWI7_9BACT|nr:50S ribosomal protein L22 [Pontibacter ruber]
MEAVARLNNVPTSPRKMRLVAGLVRGKSVSKALGLLKFEANSGAARIEKLLLSALANWQQKNEDARIEDANLYIKEIFVNEGKMLKRLRPAPQGRGYRIRKRSNHVTVVIDSLTEEQLEQQTKKSKKANK